MRCQPRRQTIGSSLREYARGLVGGLLFSLPILYTMEVWWAGFLGTPVRLLGGLLASFLLLIAYNLFAGLRREAGMGEILIDSVEELGLGLTAAALLLWMLNRVDLSMGPQEAVGKIVVAGLMMSIGISVGTAQLGGDNEADQGLAKAYREHEPWRHLALGACGAVLVAANVAPTEEIMVLGAELSVFGLLVLAVVSLASGAVILHYSEFTASIPGATAGFELVIRSTTQSYAVALLVSSGLLWFYGRLSDEAPVMICAQVIVLGFAAMLGACAGRLILQPS